MGIYFNQQTRQFSTDERRAERSENRKGQSLETAFRGHGRGMLVGGVSGVAGAAGTSDLAKKLYRDGYHKDDIKYKVGKRAYKRGSKLGRILGGIRGTLKGAGTGFLMGGPLGAIGGAIGGGLIGAGAGHLFGGLGAKLSARKRVNSMFEKSRSIDKD